LVPPAASTADPANPSGRAENGTRARTKAAASAVSSSSPTPTRRHFTRVERTDFDPDDLLSDSPYTNLFSVHTLALVLMMLALGAGAWYFLQPPSADALYARIDGEVKSGDVERMLDAEEDIRMFLARHGNDSRAEMVEEYKAEIELERLQRKLERRARLTSSSESLTPVERAYVDAIRYVRLDPEQGQEKLQALIDVYHDPSPDGGPTQQCLELAERQLTKLNSEIQDFAAESLTLLNSRLDAADELRQTDRAAARRVWRGVIALYQDKPWAASAVQRAQAALDAAESRSDVPTSPP
jgi:hypothetical protein